MSQMFGGFILRFRGHWEPWNESVSSQYLKGSEFKLCREKGEWSGFNHLAVIQSTQEKGNPSNSGVVWSLWERDHMASLGEG